MRRAQFNVQESYRLFINIRLNKNLGTKKGSRRANSGNILELCVHNYIQHVPWIEFLSDQLTQHSNWQFLDLDYQFFFTPKTYITNQQAKWFREKKKQVWWATAAWAVELMIQQQEKPALNLLSEVTPRRRSAGTRPTAHGDQFSRIRRPLPRCTSKY